KHLRLWWLPPGPRLVYAQPLSSPDAFFRSRLFLWMPYRMWAFKLLCVQPECRRLGHKLTACGLYKTVRRVLDFSGWYFMATEYLEGHCCKKKVAGWSQDILEQLDPIHREKFLFTLYLHESLGPDGVPGYHHVVNLADSLVDLRHQAFVTQQRVDSIIALWDKRPESDTGSWPSVSRLVEDVCLALCRLHLAGQTIAGTRVNRWAAVMRDYGVIRDVVLGSPGLVTRTRIQLFELNQRTLTQWYNARKKKQEQDVLHLSVGQSSTPMVAPEPLPPALNKLPERPTHGHPAFDFNIQQDASGQAFQRVRGQPPLPPGETLTSSGLEGDAASATAATPAAPAAPAGPKVPLTTAWR
ncbi:hypothetical protein P4O66_012043, partial [Electrophorus voltai]